ncbi:MAG: AAA family ATPase [Anaerolineae bacterium]|nr:AAA family ATPase [Anaerolineae bacterium]
MDIDLQERSKRFVPAQYRDHLDDPAILAEAIQHLNSLYKALCSFLPLYIEEEILKTQGYSALRPGTFMFADVSGFTALSERLQRESTQEGAEILTMVMNDYFAEMLEILAKSDGQLLKFAGDALLAFFPAKPRSIADAVKAVRTGLRMQRAIERFKPISDPRLVELLKGDQYSLVMSIGVARGKLFEMLIGNQAQRDHLILGSLPGAAMSAESVGRQDEVIVDAKLAALLVGHFSFKRMGHGFSQVVDSLGAELGDYEFEALKKRRAKGSALFDLTTDMLHDTLRQLLSRVEAMSVYVAPAVLHELINSGDYHLRSSNRFAVTMFIYATGFAELLDVRRGAEDRRDLIASMAERYYNLVQQTITEYGGTLTRTDPYQLGTKLLATFGVPVAHSDDADRAVDAALEIRQRLMALNQSLEHELPDDLRRAACITQRIGIAQGNTFAGEVGWKARREFTVMGDDVNLAARLMAKAAPGQIVISDRVYGRVQGSLEVERLPAVQLKGKQHPVQTYAVLRPLLAPVRLVEAEPAAFIGNQALLETVAAALAATVQGQGARQLVLLGHSGVGKSRLARQIARQARVNDWRVAWVNCTRRETERSVIRALLSQLLDIQPDDPTAVLQERLQALDLLDFEAQVQAALSEQVLQDTALLGLAVRLLGIMPTLLIIDDAQRASGDLLERLSEIARASGSAPVVLLLLAEPPFATVTVDTYRIADLEPNELAELAAQYLGVAAIGARLRSVLWTKTGGRPVYAEAYLESLRTHDYLFNGELRPEAVTDLLPESLREVVMTRIDSLSADLQAVLRAGAVLGGKFTPAALSVVAEISNPAQIDAIIQTLVDEHLLMAADDAFTFRRELVSSAIYTSLSRVIRLKLHRLAVSYWQAQRQERAAAQQLAGHLARCGLLPQAIEVLMNAADAAEEQDDLSRAALIYQQALEIFPDDKGVALRLERLQQRLTGE